MISESGSMRRSPRSGEVSAENATRLAEEPEFTVSAWRTPTRPASSASNRLLNRPAVSQNSSAASTSERTSVSSNTRPDTGKRLLPVRQPAILADESHDLLADHVGGPLRSASCGSCNRHARRTERANAMARSQAIAPADHCGTLMNTRSKSTGDGNRGERPAPQVCRPSSREDHPPAARVQKSIPVTDWLR